MAIEILRSRSNVGGRVAPIELFFDLVYVFAITQLSHLLLKHLDLQGVGLTLILALAVWWAWMYTAWSTNYLQPDHPGMRFTLVGVMVGGLVMAAALPDAFGEHALWFAGGYVMIQVGRTIAVTVLSRGTALQAVFIRVLVWLLLSAVLWIAGALVGGTAQVLLWLAALVVEYAAPAIGYPTPFMPRSVTTDWTIDGSHMAERCQLFVIIALGESVLVTGATLAGHDFNAGAVAAFVVSFLGSVALWWVYFDRTAEGRRRGHRRLRRPWTARPLRLHLHPHPDGAGHHRLGGRRRAGDRPSRRAHLARHGADRAGRSRPVPGRARDVQAGGVRLRARQPRGGRGRAGGAGAAGPGRAAAGDQHGGDAGGLGGRDLGLGAVPQAPGRRLTAG
ncbi:hypothetical protein FHR33_006162 [Nonomuraea dietziae]|uniref:Low temperature requirement protein A n=1 Tax=Nonomuraea dietziae TaxID=65515 RepID=A0A7W5V4B0_9ACTN|nr:low temperature requirement protein A [Nonomuraea dietziae]MBB3730302.1 hypothetical protein [Nonomuraea dietziae]